LHSKPSAQVLAQVPSAWQVRHWLALQVPQVPPQLSLPQVFPEQAGVHPQTPGVPPPPQVCGAWQLAHAPPPVPQAVFVSPDWQVPLPSQQPVVPQVQFSVLPQPSEKEPHLPA
jgi:hypothetical protein